MGKATAIDFSPFLQQLIARHPDWPGELQLAGRLDKTSPPDSGLLVSGIAKSGLESGLRLFRNREMLRIIWRDLNELAPLEETLADLSTMADICLQVATDYHTGLLETQHGVPRGDNGQDQKLVIIGLGKLGGGELNLSSDIDIIFCYPNSGACDGRGGLSNEQFFTRLARNIIRSLSEITADGFCFRVDTRLRPFGESGPLVSSFAALEQYYQREGRDWERYALIKARPVAGDTAAGRVLLDLLQPFVYRRYIDFGAIEALQTMHKNVQDDAVRHDRLDDIKRGPGGIREIEFLVQSFQLLRGGREPELQTPSLMAAADGLQKLQLLTDATVKQLLSDYRFLRRLENRIQALHDQQTHHVPDGEDGIRVARAMGFQSEEDFQTTLAQTRASVQSMFALSLPQPPAPADGQSPWQTSWQRARFRQPGDPAEPATTKPLAAFVKRLERLSLSQRAARRLDQFMPLLLERIDALSPGDVVFSLVLDLVSAICRRSVYLSLLVQNPDATNRMLSLFIQSKRVAQTVTRYPALLDELIDPQLGAYPPTKVDIQAGVDRILKGHLDTETTLQNLNYYKQVIELRISVAILQSALPVADAQVGLSRLAQNLIQATLALAGQEVGIRHGLLAGPGLAVIAYGSLGACALGFDSDLDLVFLYLPSNIPSNGPRPMAAEQYHTAVARRLLSLLSATTPSGRLYRIDSRLRPNGRSGLLVSSIDAFTRYQQEQAWLWELQALTRARPVAGNEEIAGKFDATRLAVLTAIPKDKQPGQEVAAMRKRVRAELKSGDPLKHDHGGLLDIEFVVQLGLLLNAGEFPETLASTKIYAQLQALGDCSWLDASAAKLLGHAYRQLCHARLQLALHEDHLITPVKDLLQIANPICRDILG